MVGLEKLAFAESQVGQMQIELKELQPQLVVAAEENEKMMKVSFKDHSHAARFIGTLHCSSYPYENFHCNLLYSDRNISFHSNFP